jgi:ribosomal-protein-alanine N-acetyltransferase
VDIHPLTEEGLPAALDLFEAVAAEGLWLATEAPIDRRETAARWRALVATGEGTILVAEEGGAPVGLAALAGRRAPELGMLVRRDRRGRGVGGALLEAAIDAARAAGADAVVLHVFAHNAAARALYARRGFAEVGVAREAYARRSGARWDAIRMELRLSPAAGAGARP